MRKIAAAGAEKRGSEEERESVREKGSRWGKEGVRKIAAAGARARASGYTNLATACALLATVCESWVTARSNCSNGGGALSPIAHH